MEERSNKGCLIAAVVWLSIAAVLAAAAKYLLLPSQRDHLEKNTGSDSQYSAEIRVGIDSFSGYCILRSKEIQDELRASSIKITTVDDNADIAARMKALADGRLQMAVFTIDSLIASGAELGQFPATIVMVIDETKGADAIIAYKSVASIEDLNSPDARIALTPKSPSEFLARTVIAHFNLPNMPDQWMIETDGAKAAYALFKKTPKNQKRAFALWEPYVSMALEDPDAHLLIDSSRLKGYIVDVLVAERKFLDAHPDRVRAVIEAYFRAAYAHARSAGGMAALVADDSKRVGLEPLNDVQASALATRIEWKNTLDNYAYFNIASAPGAVKGLLLEDVITNVIDVLMKTGAMKTNPLDGRIATIFYNRALKELQASGFHPGKTLNVVSDLGPGIADTETLHASVELKALTDSEWELLKPVGVLRVKPIVFARGGSRINVQSQRDMDELAKNLAAWPSYYLMIIGTARSDGDAEANLKLATERAVEAKNYLISLGVDEMRMRTRTSISETSDGSAQSVTFRVLQLPY